VSVERASYRRNDTLLFGIILGVLAFWLFAQTTLNIAPTMAADLGATNLMNIAVAITALFSGIFIVVAGGCRRSSRMDQDSEVGICFQHRRLGVGRRRAARRFGHAAPDGRSSLGLTPSGGQNP
jgi:hypothetical protein